MDKDFYALVYYRHSLYSILSEYKDERRSIRAQQDEQLCIKKIDIF